MKVAARVLGIVAAAIGILLAVLLLYLAFADLGHHKGRIESFVTRQIGRPFAIDGPFSLKLVPAIKLQADQVHIGNVSWSSTPQLLQVGHFATEIDLWSLVSGPVIVRSLELRDVTVVLESNGKGENNWTFGDPNAPPEPKEKSDVALKKLPFAIHRATLQNLLVTYHVAGEQDRQARIESLTVLPGSGDLLAIAGKGSVDEYAAALTGEAGPLESLVAGRNIRMAINASLGNLRMDAKGSIGTLDPLDGADLKLTVDNPDVGTMFRKLRVPVFADGPMRVQATMADAGKRTHINLQASAGDLTASVDGSLAVLGLRDSELDFKAQALDAARLAALFDVKGVPAEKLDVAGHVFITHTRRKPAGRSVRGTISASLGDLKVEAKGTIGHLHPLDVTDLTMTADDPDSAALLRDLQLPALTQGPLHLEGSLADDSKNKRKRVQLQAMTGDIVTNLTGSFGAQGFGQPEMQFKAQVQDAARLAGAFDVKGVPAAKLDVAGHVALSPEQLKLDGVSASLAGAQVKIDGAIARTGVRTATTHFDFSTDNLAQLKQDLPAEPVKVSGDLVSSPEQLEFSNLSATLGKTHVAGTAKIGRKVPRHVEADLSSPLLDLTPLVSKPAAAAEPGKQALKPEAKPAPKQHMFPTTPLPLEKLQGLDAHLRLVATELRANTLLLKNVDATVTVKDGHLLALAKANGGYSGNLDGKVDLVPTTAGAAELKVNLNLKDLRAGIGGGDTVKHEEVPPTTLMTNITANGNSPRQLASSSSGSFLLMLGPGKTRKGALGKVGGDVINQLFSKLNPFAKEDPYTKLDCTVARIDIKQGKAAIAPVLMQTDKVTVTADGTVDLVTEALALDFNTRPRSGIGISPGMFTNPFLELRGTLVKPTVGVGAKGVTSGALAAATAGATVVVKAAVDRVKGEVDMCKKTLEEAQHPPPAKGNKS
jgi:uncharacterized protein involved in outer membrane biogenesis